MMAPMVGNEPWKKVDRQYKQWDADPVSRKIGLAASNERFSASGELMSGFGAPVRTATPTTALANPVALSGAILLCCASSSKRGFGRMTMSALSPPAILFTTSPAVAYLT